jgi:hypothetical protein
MSVVFKLDLRRVLGRVKFRMDISVWRNILRTRVCVPFWGVKSENVDAFVFLHAQREKSLYNITNKHKHHKK